MSQSRLDIARAMETATHYASLGYQRTGSQVQSRTLEWLEQRLLGEGAKVQRQAWPYMHYEYRTGLPDNQVMPLYYSGLNRGEVHNPCFAEVDGHGRESDVWKHMTDLAAAATHKGFDSLVLTTRGQNDLLCGINSRYENRIELPVLLSAPSFTARIENHLPLDPAARVSTAQTWNLVAKWSRADNAPGIIVTTPVSGWFHCAAERGSGVGLALELTGKLAATHDVTLILASGHELGYLGGWWAAQHYVGAPQPILHLGSSLGGVDSWLIAISNLEEYHRPGLESVLSPLGLRPCYPGEITNPDNWVGESECWCSKAWPMLSIAGQSPAFHTPADLAETELSVDAMARVGDALFNAAWVMSQN